MPTVVSGPRRVGATTAPPGSYPPAGTPPADHGYRAELPNAARTVVAIKALKLDRMARDAARKDGEHKFSGMSQFRKEVEVLGKYRHPNIVALLGHCIDSDTASRPCLVYEFMPGASLRERLQAQTRMPPLPPAARLVIASDVARGLTFLHTVAKPPIIHQDIKSDNILLGAAPGAGRVAA